MKSGERSEWSPSQPGDAAEKAFHDLQRLRTGGQRPPGLAAALVIGLILLVGVGAAAFIVNRDRNVTEPTFFFDFSESEARGLPDPPDLGGAPDLGRLVDWSHESEPIGYDDHITVVWFKRSPNCTTCWMNSRYWESLFIRHWPDGLQVVSIVDLPPDRLTPEDAIWRAAADPGGNAARTFYLGEAVPEDYVVVIDSVGHIRLSATGKPVYDTVEPVVAKLLYELNAE